MRALTRPVPDSFGRALCANAATVPIDVSLARDQHARYCAALEACGAEVLTVPVEDRFPDCVFVEDTAIIIDGQAWITRPGAPSRRGETEAVADALAAWLPVERVTEPATLDGGDCMVVDRTLFVGRSARTNAAAIAQLDQALTPRGVRVVAIELPPDVLHLKCVCSPLGPDRVLLAAGTLDPAAFRGLELVMVPAEETYASNAVAIGTQVIVADGFPRTLAALVAAGLQPHPVPCSEVRKADGSLTCQSIVFSR